MEYFIAFGLLLIAAPFAIRSGRWFSVYAAVAGIASPFLLWLLSMGDEDAGAGYVIGFLLILTFSVPAIVGILARGMTWLTTFHVMCILIAVPGIWMAFHGITMFVEPSFLVTYWVLGALGVVGASCVVRFVATAASLLIAALVSTRHSRRQPPLTSDLNHPA